MRFLADENFPGPAVHALRAAHFDVGWVAEDERAIDDEAVLARSIRESRVLLTFDKDFGELAFRRRMPAHSGVVLFRLPDQSLDAVVRIVLQAISSNHPWQGSFAVVTDGRIRIRSLRSPD